MQHVRLNKQGFTIVELLIVIVVIAILAAITIVAYNGIQGRARDSKRKEDLSSLQKALELYHIDNSAYPTCASTPGYNSPPAFSSNSATYCLADDLVPKYIAAIPTDPVNSGSSSYLYAAGYKKTGATTFDYTTPSDNYILGVKLDTVTSPTYSGWGYSDLTYLIGSSN